MFALSATPVALLDGTELLKVGSVVSTAVSNGTIAAPPCILF